MLSVRFDNLEEVKQFYDPIIVERAARSTVSQLHNRSATLISKTIRESYSIKAGDIKSALKKRVVVQGGVPSAYLIYTSQRISLRHFAPKGKPSSRSRPKVKTARGTRRGAKIKVTKRRGARLIKGAFWGRAAIGTGDGKALGQGEWQIFQRIGLGRLKIRKLTGPSISHMVRGKAPLDAIDQLVRDKADTMLAHNLDHFLRTKTGIR